MIEWLGANRGLEPADAYLLCSTAANLRISEIVDAPNWLVSLHFPLDIFRPGVSHHAATSPMLQGARVLG